MSIAWPGRVSRRVRTWARQHSYSFFSSLGVILKHKTGTLMTVLVLGIAMFLPLGLYITLNNLDDVDLRQDHAHFVTVYSPRPLRPRSRHQILARQS